MPTKGKVIIRGLPFVSQQIQSVLSKYIIVKSPELFRRAVELRWTWLAPELSAAKCIVKNEKL
jgi:hypothetical protein